MDEIIIRNSVKDDCERIFKQLQNETCSHEDYVTLQDFVENGFQTAHPPFESIIAEDENNTLVGFAIWSIGYSTWKGMKMFVEELWLSEHLRGTEFEAKFVSRLNQEALKLGCAEIRTTTEKGAYMAEIFLKAGGIDATEAEKWHLFSIENKNTNQ
ncbi:diamine acetyltransferase 2-like [Cimex lectularius]|uniref:N-acetyltransferase domain-containing protein n=1 Tax=Cimex lectularius TaxID=79782 RepID=A0A8I6RQY3_CIMLE|nr:diamine acetyltransferase 2-like [Cimex lectularius]